MDGALRESSKQTGLPEARPSSRRGGGTAPAGARGRKRGGSGVRPHGLAIYLSDPAAIGGTAGLFAQLRETTACAGMNGLSPKTATLYVDSGRPDGAPVLGSSLRRLLADVASGRVTHVIVAGLHRFSSDRAEAEALADRMRRHGCILTNASDAAARSGAVRPRMMSRSAT